MIVLLSCETYEIEKGIFVLLPIQFYVPGYDVHTPSFLWNFENFIFWFRFPCWGNRIISTISSEIKWFLYYTRLIQWKKMVVFSTKEWPFQMKHVCFPNIFNISLLITIIKGRLRLFFKVLLGYSATLSIFIFTNTKREPLKIVKTAFTDCC